MHMNMLSENTGSTVARNMTRTIERTEAAHRALLKLLETIEAAAKAGTQSPERLVEIESLAKAAAILHQMSY